MTTPFQPLPCAGGSGTSDPGLDVEGSILCDLLPDGTVAGTALVEAVYDAETGLRTGTRVVNPVTGALYVPTGTLQPCDRGTPGTAMVYAECGDVPRQAIAFGPNLIDNGDFSQSLGEGGTSTEGPGFSTGYSFLTSPCTSIFDPCAGGNYMAYFTTNAGQVTGNAGPAPSIPALSTKSLAVNVGADSTIPLLCWPVALITGQEYELSADVAIIFAPYDVKLTIDGVDVLVLTAPDAAGVWQRRADRFTWSGSTGLHALCLASNSAALSGNDHAFDNFALRQVSPAQAEVFSECDYDARVRACIEQIVQTTGCNDDRRDQILATIAAAAGGSGANEIVTDLICVEGVTWTRVQLVETGAGSTIETRYFGPDGVQETPPLAFAQGPCATPPGLTMGTVCYQGPTVPGQAFRGNVGGATQNDPGSVTLTDFQGSGVDVTISSSTGTDVTAGAGDVTLSGGDNSITVTFSTPVHLQALSAGEFDAGGLESWCNLLPVYSGVTGTLQGTPPGCITSTVNNGNPDGDVQWADPLTSSLTFDRVSTGGGEFLLELGFALPAASAPILRASVVKCDGCDATVRYFDTATGLEVLTPTIVDCPGETPGTVALVADCASLGQPERLGPDLIQNGDFASSSGTGAQSKEGPGWFTSLTPSSDVTAAVQGRWALFEGFGHDVSSDPNADFQARSGRSFMASGNQDPTIPLVAWSSVPMKNGATYRVTMDVASADPSNWSTAILVGPDQLFSVFAIPAPSGPTFFETVTFDFTYGDVTDTVTVGIVSTSINVFGFDNFELREVIPAVPETLTPVAYASTVRAVVDQVVDVAGCNDKRRDDLLTQVVDRLVELRQDGSSAGCATASAIGEVCYTTLTAGTHWSGDWAGATVDDPGDGSKTFTKAAFGGSPDQLVLTSAASDGLIVGGGAQLGAEPGPNDALGTLTFPAPVLNVSITFGFLGTNGNERVRNISPPYTSLFGDGDAVGTSGIDPNTPDGSVTVTIPGPVSVITWRWQNDGPGYGTLASVAWDETAAGTDVERAAMLRDCDTNAITLIDLATGATLDQDAITIVDCASSSGSGAGTEVLQLCDRADPQNPVAFLRHLVYDAAGAVASSTDTTLDGTTAFVPTGPVGSCETDTCIAPDTELLELCDVQPNGDSIPFLRHISYTCDGVVADVVDTDLTGLAPYVITGEIGACAGCCPVVVAEVCLANGHPGAILRLSDGTLSRIDTVTGLAFVGADIVTCAPTMNAQGRLLTAATSWTSAGDVAGALVGLTVTVLTGTVTIVDQSGTSIGPLSAGVSTSWSNPEGGTLLGPQSITTAAASTALVTWTQR